MSHSLCSTGYAYDAEDAANVAFAVTDAVRKLGATLQARGVLTDCRVKGTGRLHPDFAGELAAVKLNLGHADLLSATLLDIERWADAYLDGLPFLARITALQAELDARRELATTGS